MGVKTKIIYVLKEEDFLINIQTKRKTQRKRMRAALVPFLGLVVVLVQGSRIPLSDKALPYLAIDTLGAGILRWNSASVLDEVQRAQIIEISPRGLRFIFDSTNSHHHSLYVNNNNEDQNKSRNISNKMEAINAKKNDEDEADICIPDRECLCSIDGNRFLPSPAANRTYNITFSGDPTALKRSKVLHAYASATACAYNGGGRVLSSKDASYTVSGCDVLQGKLVALYFPRTNRLLLRNQTLGPMAYTASIVVFYFFIIMVK